MKNIFTFLIVILFSQQVVISQNLDLKSELQTTIDKILEDYKIPGITLAVVFDDEKVINLASGFNNIERQIKMQPDTRMLSGSVGKMFVSTIALQLIENGELNLNENISYYLGDRPWFKRLPNYKNIKIKNLLNHTSGLPRYIFQPEFLKDIKEKPLVERTPESCITYILDKKALHQTNNGFAYSDTNYIILGLIIEQISNKSYYTLLKENILKPIGLKQTSPSINRALKGLAQGYIGSQNYFGLPKTTIIDDLLVINPAFEWTGGGVITNVLDLALFTKQLHEGNLISEESKKILIQPVNMNNGKPFDQGYGLGSFVWSKKNDTRYGHSGFFPGYLSHVEYSKNRQYAIAIQINTDEGYPFMQQFIYYIDEVISKYLDKIDEKKILENFKKQEQCWNAHNIECYMEAYAKNETIQTASRGGITFGYTNIISDYKKYFPKERMGNLHFDNFNFRRLSDNLYFTTGRFNLKYPNREELSSGWFSVVMKKINGHWFIITDHSS